MKTTIDLELDSILAIAIRAVRRAEEVFKTRKSDRVVLLSQEGDKGKEWKVDLDFLLEREIITEISRNSTFPILSEESIPEENLGESYWVVDPLDGSANCFRGLPGFAIAVAFWTKGQPTVGVVLDLIHGELYWGCEGHGAFCNDAPITVADVEVQSQRVLCTGFPTALVVDQEFLDKMLNICATFSKVRMLGSAALSLAYVAAGKCDSYWERRIALWDVAAGLAIVRAAGGIVRFSEVDQTYRLTVSAACDECVLVKCDS